MTRAVFHIVLIYLNMASSHLFRSVRLKALSYSRIRPHQVSIRYLSSQKHNKLTARSATFPDDAEQFEFLSSEIIPKIRQHAALNADSSVPVLIEKVE